MGVFTYLKSTILSKVVMAVTGVILVLFIIGHTLGNLQIYLGPETFNGYAEFLQGLGEILWIIRIVLFLSLVFHIITSVYLKFHNLNSKPTAYKVKNYVKAKLTSRTMIWTGIMIFAFLTYHLLHFTFGVTNPEHYNQKEVYSKKAKLYAELPFSETEFEGKKVTKIDQFEILHERHDVYKMVVLGFRNPFISLAYVIGVILLGFHLSHAIQSAFQTLGCNNPRYFQKIVDGSNTFATIIVLCLISIPITIYFGIIGRAV